MADKKLGDLAHLASVPDTALMYIVDGSTSYYCTKGEFISSISALDLQGVTANGPETTENVLFRNGNKFVKIDSVNQVLEFWDTDINPSQAISLLSMTGVRFASSDIGAAVLMKSNPEIDEIGFMMNNSNGYQISVFLPESYSGSDLPKFLWPAKATGDYFIATTQDIEDAVSTKLDITDYNDRFKGKFASLVALETAHPTANAGDYAQVDSGSGSDVVNYNYDSEDGWVSGSSGSGATDTDALPEGSANLYFQTGRVLATVLSGLSLATGTAVVSSDTILVGIGKLQKQITDLSTIYQVILTSTNFGALIAGFTSKTTPVDADYIPLMNSADSNKAYQLSWLNLKTTLLAFFKPYYVNILLNDTVTGSTITGTTSNTLLKPAYDLLENVFSDGDTVVIDFYVTKVAGTNAAATAGLYMHSSGSLSGATKIQGSNGGSTIKDFRCQRTLIFKSATTFEIFDTSTNNFYDIGGNTPLPSTVTYNTATHRYLMPAILPSSASDSYALNRLTITRIPKKVTVS